jgi:two-component system, OmpR family, sensor kinase
METERPPKLGRALDVILSPRRWPVRWRITAVSAGLTLFILVCFALIVGRLAAEKIESEFQDDLRSSAASLAVDIELHQIDLGPVLYSGPPLDRVAITNDAAVRIVYPTGQAIRETADSPSLGRPRLGVVRVGDMEVATAQIPQTEGTPAFVQYARARSNLEGTVDRLWLLLALGVVGGTVLATLAGLAVAGRAMRPVAALTATAGEIASTRDPSQRIPEPEADDEVGELARTLDQMLRELDAARTEREQSMQVQREFIADASHELRTPLTSILANLELLEEQLSSGERNGEEGEIVSSALSSSRRMRRLVADLLLLARADAGHTGLRAPCDLASIAESALAEVQPVADGHRLELEVAEPVEIEGNPDELHRLAVNLLDNGLRHTPSGSTIEIRVGRRDGQAVLEVADDGPGLPADAGDELFARFARLGGPADVIGDSGTGLGLAIVKAVAGSHGGDVQAGPSPAGGARFTVTLPLRPDRDS